MNNMLTLNEVKAYLDVNQKQLEKYLQQGKLHAYKIGGTYIRFRKEEVMTLRYEIVPSVQHPVTGRTFFALLGDFWRFNNFYIVSILLVIAAIVWMVNN